MASWNQKKQFTPKCTRSCITCTLFPSSLYLHWSATARFAPSFTFRSVQFGLLYAQWNASQFLPQLTQFLNHSNVWLILFLFLACRCRFHQNIQMNSYIIFFTMCCMKLWKTPTNLSANNVVIFMNPVKVVVLIHATQENSTIPLPFLFQGGIVVEWKDVFDLYIVWHILCFWHYRKLKMYGISFSEFDLKKIAIDDIYRKKTFSFFLF